MRENRSVTATDSSAGDSSLDGSGEVNPTWISFAFSSEVLSFPDEYISEKRHM